MSITQAEKGARFRALHDGPGIFVIPNPWDVGSALVAEGIETAGELQTLRDLGVGYGQGFFLAPPGDLDRPPVG